MTIMKRHYLLVVERTVRFNEMKAGADRVDHTKQTFTERLDEACLSTSNMLKISEKENMPISSQRVIKRLRWMLGHQKKKKISYLEHSFLQELANDWTFYVDFPNSLGWRGGGLLRGDITFWSFIV